MVSNIKNFNENIEDDNEELEPSIEELFDIDDLLNNDKTKEILTNQHYFDFLYNMENNIQNLYIKFKNNSKCYHFLDNDEFDLDGMFFVDIVYKHIYKKYTPDFFYTYVINALCNLVAFYLLYLLHHLQQNYLILI